MRTPTVAPDQISVAAIVNSFNRLALLEVALQSLAENLTAAVPTSAIVIFDAGSTDGSREWIEQFRLSKPGVFIHVIHPATGDDTSFAAGVNTACEYAIRTFPKLQYFFLYETDNYLASPQPVEMAIDLLEARPELGAAGFTVRKHTGAAAGYGCRFPTKWDFALGQQVAFRLKLDAPNNTPWNSVDRFSWRLCDCVFTSPLLVKKVAWESIGGFDVKTFPFSDCDLDLAWRMRDRKWLMAVIKTGDAVHDNNELLSSWSATRTLNFHRGRLKVLRRHRGRFVGWLKLLLFMRHCLEFFAIVLVHGRTRKLKSSLQQRLLLAKTVFKDYQPNLT